MTFTHLSKILLFESIAGASVAKDVECTAERESDKLKPADTNLSVHPKPTVFFAALNRRALKSDNFDRPTN